MSETISIYGIDVPSDAVAIGFRGIVQGNYVDIVHDRRVSHNTNSQSLDKPSFDEFVSWVQDEYDTHVKPNVETLEDDKMYEHAWGGDCEARWRKAGGYLYFLAWRTGINGK
jgi:hypothetical protein